MSAYFSPFIWNVVSEASFYIPYVSSKTLLKEMEVRILQHQAWEMSEFFTGQGKKMFAHVF